MEEMMIEKIDENMKIVMNTLNHCNEEIVLLRNEFAESWWSHNGWKFRHKNKFDVFYRAKQAFLSMPIDLRENRPSSEILEKSFLGIAEAKNG
jgi:hypothetical protein